MGILSLRVRPGLQVLSDGPAAQGWGETDMTRTVWNAGFIGLTSMGELVVTQSMGGLLCGFLLGCTFVAFMEYLARYG